MNYNFHCTVALMFLASLPVLAGDPTPHETNDKIYIVVQEPKAKIREVPLDKKVIDEVSKMQGLELGPLLALSTLAVAGLDCCPHIEKLSDTVWRCCDGKKTIVTNSVAVGKILAIAREVKRSEWERFKRDEHIMAGDRKVLDKLLERKPQA